MKTFFYGFVSGAVLLGVLAVFEIKNERIQKYEMGKTHGAIEAFGEIYTAIRIEFGPIQEGVDERLLYSKKANDIVVIEENGIKTIRAK